MTYKKYLSTWIVLDDENSASLYPQAGRLSSADPRVHFTYWRCVASFFAVAQHTVAQDCIFRLYTNLDASYLNSIPRIEAVLKQCNVEIVTVPRNHIPPEGYFGQWRNQFYILDVIDFIAAENEESSHLILDSDCLCMDSLDGAFAAIQQNRALTMLLDTRPGENINGLTLETMGQVFTEISGKPLSEPCAYYAGEIFAATGDAIRTMQPIAENAWQTSLERHAQGKLKFNEEAHLLSYVYWTMGLASGTADRFIKRLWTGIHYRNGVSGDERLAILHLPSEKRFGYVWLFKAIEDKNSWFYKEKNLTAWRRRLLNLMSVPRPRLPKMTYEFLTYAKAWAGRKLSLRSK